MCSVVGTAGESPFSKEVAACRSAIESMGTYQQKAESAIEQQCDRCVPAP